MYLEQKGFCDECGERKVVVRRASQPRLLCYDCEVRAGILAPPTLVQRMLGWGKRVTGYGREF